MDAAFLRVFGRLHEDGRYEADRGWETPVLARRAADDPTLRLELLDRSGACVARGAMERRTPLCSGERPLQPRVQRVRGQVVLARDAARLVVREGERILHEAAVSAERPVVGAIAAAYSREAGLGVRWEATHTAGLTFDVTLLDATGTPIPLARRLAEPAFRLEAAHVPASGTARIAVLASDGVRSASRISEPIALPRRAPTLVLLAPGDDAVIDAGQPLSLIGHALDAAGRSLPDEGLVWHVDGHPVARGTRIAPVDPLAPGSHVIELAYGGGGRDRAEAVVRRTVVVRAGAQFEQWQRGRAWLAAEAWPFSAPAGVGVAGATREGESAGEAVAGDGPS